ncbi:unnamed protein product [Phaedon cochleariae]|uniref:Uncharacterized protein n=1 Tax=Phaedon cochleariae TaxID=80249 RepID=A0A9P0GLX9_PHACE|nr:unnamed protein product [Phaedon cochleariae]
MDYEASLINSQPEVEEDDYGCYFLEPSSNPYNLNEKIQQANGDLFSSNLSPTKKKSSKVKFRDELISFEPDLTDEDVNSIESDQVEIQHEINVQSSDVNIFDIEEVEEVEEEEVVEEINSAEEDFPVSVIQQESKRGPDQIDDKNINDHVKTNSGKINKKKKKDMENRSFWNAHEVHCKDHCIDRFDFELSMSINKLEIHEKEGLPPLQLLRRRCCDEVKQKMHKTLPNYNGYRSEYGLTSRQLEKREKQMETLRLKEQTRQRLIEEYRKRKMKQNEEVFSQWLKEVSKRRTEKEKVKKPMTKQCYSPSVISLPIGNKAKERPKTAGFIPKTQIKKPRRPHTSSSCVFIKVPQSILERGINIGDLIITNSKLLTRRLHILALS